MFTTTLTSGGGAPPCTAGIGPDDTDSLVFNVTTAVNINDKNLNNFSFYPNPANETLVIEGIHKGDQITIYNLFGIVVLNHVAIMDKELLNVSSLMSGMYQIHISGYRNTKSFIKK